MRAIHRRAVVTGIVGSAPVFSSGTLGTLLSPSSASSNDVSPFVGPMPDLPPLPPRPYPHRAQFLFTDGSVATVDSFARAVMIYPSERQGISRKVPYGFPIETDAQKLYLLGRRTFAPGELVWAMRRKPNEPGEASRAATEAAIRKFGPPKTGV